MQTTFLPEPAEESRPRMILAAEQWTVAPGDVWQCGRHRLVCGDSTDAAVTATALDGTLADAVITDPPYGIQQDEWDTGVDVEAVVEATTRVVQPDAFFAFSIQMPPMLRWISAADQHYRFRDHIVWVKRNPGINRRGASRLSRAHESILIYRCGNAEYANLKGRYEDVKIPGILFNTYTIEGLKRQWADLWRVVHGDDPLRNRQSTRRHLVYHHHEPYRWTVLDSEHVNYTNVWSFLPENSAHQTSDSRNHIPHATVKPVLLWARLVGLLVADGGRVYDPFLGSGTTLVASEHEGRVGIGVEINPQFCALTLAQLAQLGVVCERVGSVEVAHGTT